MAKLYAQVVGIVLLIVGIVGLFSATLLGARTTVVHNLIHLVSGAIGAYTGFSGSGSRSFAQIFGIIYTLTRWWASSASSPRAPLAASASR